MLTGKQLRIFEVFAKQPFAEYTRKQIKQASKEKSNNALALAVKQFANEGLIKEKKVGRSSLIRLDMNNDTTYYYIALANLQRTNKIVKRVLSIVEEDISKVTHYYSLVIFGSYAAQEQRKDSDIDLAVLIESAEKKKPIEAALNSAALKSLLTLDAHVITKNELIEMLTNDDENLGKQIARKHLAVRNHQIFYRIVQEGMKHGFRV